MQYLGDDTPNQVTFHSIDPYPYHLRDGDVYDDAYEFSHPPSSYESYHACGVCDSNAHSCQCDDGVGERHVDAHAHQQQKAHGSYGSSYPSISCPSFQPCDPSLRGVWLDQ